MDEKWLKAHSTIFHSLCGVAFRDDAEYRGVCSAESTGWTKYGFMPKELNNMAKIERNHQKLFLKALKEKFAGEDPAGANTHFARAGLERSDQEERVHEGRVRR